MSQKPERLGILLSEEWLESAQVSVREQRWSFNYGSEGGGYENATRVARSSQGVTIESRSHRAFVPWSDLPSPKWDSGARGYLLVRLPLQVPKGLKKTFTFNLSEVQVQFLLGHPDSNQWVLDTEARRRFEPARASP